MASEGTAGWKRSRVAAGCMCVVAVLVIGVSAASAKPGDFDRSFGKAGKVKMPLQLQGGDSILRTPVQMATTPGAVVVAQGRTVIRFRANGRLDSDFGQNGRILIEEPEGSRFTLSGLAIDSLGRILVAGTMRPTPESSMAGPPSSPRFGVPWATAVVVRYLPDGTPDASFGSGGTISTDFGLPPPITHLYSDGNAFTYEAAAVAVTGLTVDRDDRPVLTGTVVTEVSLCSLLTLPVTVAYIARLDASGGQDPTFHGTGVVVPEGPFLAAQPIVDGAGAIMYVARAGSQCEKDAGPPTPSLGGLLSDGSPDSRFGPAGLLPVDVNRIALGARDHILAADRSRPSLRLPGAKPGKSRTRLIRLRPNGTLDRRFGRNGTVAIWLPRGQTSLLALTVDRQGRPLLAGHLAPTKRFISGRAKIGARKFVLVRLGKTGSLDQSFGRGGLSVAGFGGRSHARGEQVAVDRRGRAIVAGTLIGPALRGGQGLALARFRLNG